MTDTAKFAAKPGSDSTTEVKRVAEVDVKTPAADVKTPAVEKPKASKKMVVTVHGDMHDPMTGVSYTLAPQELFQPSGWVDSQIEAGKMKYVD
jgi:hypothetical protein